MINICIIHYNTPKLTECLVRSINHFTPNCKIFVFDNSDSLPFSYRTDNIRYIDNTKGQIIDFDKWLKKFPKSAHSAAKLNRWGSAKHCVSVEKCMDIIGDGFILLDSDILLTRDISDFWDEKMMYVGHVINQPRSSVKRVLPYLCFINTKMCKKYNVHYFDESRMHGLMCTNLRADADNYDTGAAFYINVGRFPKKDLNIDDYMVHYGGGSWTKEKALKVKYYLTPEQWLVKYRDLWDTENKHMNKKVIYTCITGGYDSLIPGVKVSDGFDYVCFTDNMNLNNEGVWKLRPIPKETEGLSNVKKQRYVKVNAHKLFPNYDLSIWVDGNIEIKDDLNEFLKTNCSDESVVFMPAHPTRRCIYDEGKACKSIKKDVAANIDPQLSRYKEEGFPEKYGLVQSGITIRKHNDPYCIKLMETWWKEIYNGSHRDQLSFNYALWKIGSDKFKYLDKNLFNSKYFYWRKTHGAKSVKSQKPVTVSTPSTVQSPVQEKKSLAESNFVFGDSLIGSGCIKQPKKFKPQSIKLVGKKYPKTKSLKAILSI